MNLKKWQIHQDNSLKDGLSVIELNHCGILFAHNDDMEIIGVATDGDIRRSLLDGKKLDSKILSLVNKEYISAGINSSREELMKKFDNGITAIPILTSKNKLQDVITRDNLPVINQGKIYARSKAPVRVTFGGGGSDLTHYFKNDRGAVLNATISIFSHALLKKRVDKRVIICSYDLNETLKANTLKQALLKKGSLKLIQSILETINPHFGFELYINSDFPVGSGLGGSSAVMASVIGCFNEFREDKWNLHEIAELAYQAERILMGVSGGWQDQYASVFGGFNFMEFNYDNNNITPLRLSKDIILELEENLVLCDLNLPHDSNTIHNDQKIEMEKPKVNKLVTSNVALTDKIKDSLIKGKIIEIGQSLDKVWELKKQFGKKITNSKINKIYEDAKKNGAIGGKLLGAGGGGFFLFYASSSRKNELVSHLKDTGKIVRNFQFDQLGLQSWKIRENDS